MSNNAPPVTVESTLKDIWNNLQVIKNSFAGIETRLDNLETLQVKVASAEENISCLTVKMEEQS